MIAGIGTDLCDIRRIESLLEKFGDRFTHKTFTKNERKRADSVATRGSSYAKRFAAKEAVAKALAGPNTGALSWQDVEVVNAPSGLPQIILHGKALKRVESRLERSQTYNIHLSLTDDYPYAQAYVIFEIL
ncbi:MAG: holo-ACP synthase [Robiginitomaculum sp.]|nr:MAG: holo-ACP synthase [Robiginitomaculum sp.]